ncbi:DUF805 domain-containing protein [Algicella marina]|uniref:DUF805 domain-containing protein n=1 Tax=Algicella marina TaxID=2683284 RepID=A0A6P1T417_9RHOB|nr:DUF805 domain-containing protein [Algicella marina]QHQ36009.1 DUF805 domain-containing protein [Algicella marina]
MLDLLTFSGRLGRSGWFANLILIGVILWVYTFPRAEIVLARPGPLDLEDETTIQALLGVIVPLYILLSSAVRRLRDGGSPLPFLELIIGSLIPGIGQLWLAIRLFLWGSSREKRSEPAEAQREALQVWKKMRDEVASVATKPSKEEAYKARRSASQAKHVQRHEDINARAEARRQQINKGRKDTGSDPVTRLHSSGETVRRLGRRRTMRVRQIGF